MKPLLIGIGGGTGSGKSTLVRQLASVLGDDRVSTLSMDAYYRDLSGLSAPARNTVNFDHPEALDLPLLLGHLDRLAEGQPVPMPRYDFPSHTRLEEATTVEARPLVLLNGILVLAIPLVRERLDLAVFVDAEADVRFIRRFRRDALERGRSHWSVIEQYLNTVRPMHIEFVEPSKRHADIVMPNGAGDDLRVEQVVERIEALATGD